MKKRNIIILLMCFLCSAIILTNAPSASQVKASASKIKATIVSQHGQLKVSGSKLCDKNGKVIQLKGMSSHGLQWHPLSAKAVDNLADNWKCSVIRAAMYTSENGYIGNEAAMKAKVKTVVDEAIKKGIYVIIDWHILHDGNPNTYKTQSKAFFTEMSKKYGSYPNVIYEICNEPNGDASWNDIKTYANYVIPAIRKNDPDNIIVVGTPNWSQGVNTAADNPIKGKNIMYALHFYAGSHGITLQLAAEYALSKGIAIFVTEWGTTDASGNGKLYLSDAKGWIDWMNKNKLSWCNWSYCNQAESTAVLKLNASMDTSSSASQLTESGKWVKALISGGK
jgi:endoglucanase